MMPEDRIRTGIYGAMCDLDLIVRNARRHHMYTPMHRYQNDMRVFARRADAFEKRVEIGTISEGSDPRRGSRLIGFDLLVYGVRAQRRTARLVSFSRVPVG